MALPASISATDVDLTVAPVSFAVIGAGRIAGAYADAFASSDEVAVAAVADVAPAAAHALVEQLTATFTEPRPAPTTLTYSGDAEELADRLLDEGVEAALVTAPPDTHPSLTCALAARGLAVLCEKPFAPDPISARRMIAAAAQAGATMTVAAKFRYHEPLHFARELFSAGFLGPLHDFACTFASPVAMAGRWNARPEVSGGGVIADNGPHAFDLAHLCSGPIARVSAHGSDQHQSLGVEDEADIELEFMSGTTGRIHLSWNRPSPSDEFVHLSGTTGAVSVGWSALTLQPAAGPPSALDDSGYAKVACLRAELENFARAHRGLEPLAITSVDALATVEAVAAAYRSLQTGSWVPVPAC